MNIYRVEFSTHHVDVHVVCTHFSDVVYTMGEGDVDNFFANGEVSSITRVNEEEFVFIDKEGL
jgi:hypothetical protein